MGSRCHIGIFRKSKYPRLQESTSVTITFELSPPEKELTITPHASGLEFFPRDLVISPVHLEDGKLYRSNMTLTARLPGIHSVTYTLSGVAADSYQSVTPDAVVVFENGTCCNGTLDNSLPVGCHKIKLLKCPLGGKSLYATSTESWKITRGKVSTKGIASVLSLNNLTLPLGIQGAALDKLNVSQVSALISEDQCKSQPSKNIQCLPTEILALAFLQSLRGSLPSWFRLIPSKTLSSFDTNDAITYIWTGLQLKGVLKGLGLSINEQSYYSALLYTGDLSVEVNKSSVTLPKYNQNTHLVVTELCSQFWPANVLIMFNPLSYEALQSMPIYQQLASQGWIVSAMAVQFSRRGALNFLVNTKMQSDKLVSGDLELFGRVEKVVNGSHPIISLGVLFGGIATYKTSNIDQVSSYRVESLLLYVNSNAILGDPGATSRDDAILSGESLLRGLKSPWELILTEPVPEVVEFHPANWAEKYFSAQSAMRSSWVTLSPSCMK